MKSADKYFNNCREIAMSIPDLMQRRVRYNVFARKNTVVCGVSEAIKFIEDHTYGPVKVSGVMDRGYVSASNPVLIIEGLFHELVNLETTYLGMLSMSGAAENMRKIVEAASGIPVIDMSARHYPSELIPRIAYAAYIGGASGTSTQEGYEHVQSIVEDPEFNVYASLPHAMAAFVAEMASHSFFFPSIMAARLFHETYPDQPVTVLVDYEGKELDVARQAYEVFGDQLFAVRLDTHGGRKMQGVGDRKGINIELDSPIRVCCDDKYFYGNGVTVNSVFVMRKFLDEIGAKNTKIVVSSGFNEKKVAAFKAAKAPMDFIGTGSWVNFMMFTSDITHVFEDGQWVNRAKVGRQHHEGVNHRLLFERK